MNIKELRVGNYVDYEATFHVIDSLLDNRVVHFWLNRKNVAGDGYYTSYDDIEPLELNHKYLIDFGFNFDTVIYDKFNILLSVNNNGGYNIFINSLSNGKLHITIKYVHELQNLWYALNQTELTW